MEIESMNNHSGFSWKLHTNCSWTEDEYIENMNQQLDEIDPQYHTRALMSILVELTVSFPDWSKARSHFRSLYHSIIFKTKEMF